MSDLTKEELETLTPADIALLTDKRNEGVKASLILEEPVFKSAMERVKSDAMRCAMDNLPGSKEAMHFHYLYAAACEVEKELQAYVSGAEHASFILKAVEDIKREENKPARVWIDPPKK